MADELVGELAFGNHDSGNAEPAKVGRLFFVMLSVVFVPVSVVRSGVLG